MLARPVIRALFTEEGGSGSVFEAVAAEDVPHARAS